MARLLLTQSQVSAVISSGIFCFFALLLFLVGYVQQQKTVSGLKDAVKPRLPQPPPSLAVQQPSDLPELQPSRFFGRTKDGEGKAHVTYTDFKREDLNTNIDWKRLAHVQLVANHHDVCNAIMILADLHQMRSPARRLLLFPQAWAAEKKDKADRSDPFLDSSRRLIKRAAKRYGVELRPISPVVKGEDEEGKDDVYSLTSAYALRDLDRVLSLEAPGLIMDTSPLDAVLAFTESSSFAMLHDTAEGDGVHAEDLFLLQPSPQTHYDLTEHFGSKPNFNDTQLSTFFSDHLLLESSSDSSALIRSVGALHDVDGQAEFNRTAFLSDLAYLRFSDPKLPGPEYDVPWVQKRDARPKNKDADWVWTKLYGEFAQKRIDVCGLDLEYWRP